MHPDQKDRHSSGATVEAVDGLCKMNVYSTRGADSGQAMSGKNHTIRCNILCSLRGTLKYAI
jgi:hypothetical protein